MRKFLSLSLLVLFISVSANAGVYKVVKSLVTKSPAHNVKKGTKWVAYPAKHSKPFIKHFKRPVKAVGHAVKSIAD